MEQTEMEEKNLPQQIQLPISVPINWIVPDSIETRHATNLLIQQRGTEFTLLFFEARPPIFTGTVEEQIRSYQNIKSLDAVCVARIVVSVENIQEMLQGIMKAMQQLQEQINQALN